MSMFVVATGHLTLRSDRGKHTPRVNTLCVHLHEVACRNWLVTAYALAAARPARDLFRNKRDHARHDEHGATARYAVQVPQSSCE